MTDTNLSRRQIGAILAMIGGVAIAAGTIMPWLTVAAPLLGTISRSGLDMTEGEGTALRRRRVRSVTTTLSPPS